MKLFKIFLFLLLGFAAKTMRSQAPHVYTAKWCISFSNPDYIPTLSDMSYIAQPTNWIAMGRWRNIPGTGISYSPNLNSMRMWADTICSIINRKCRPAYYITPATLAAYIQSECMIKDMSGGGVTYRNYNAQFVTGAFGYEENRMFVPGTMSIADKNSGICFMKISNKACANPNDPNLPEVKSEGSKIEEQHPIYIPEPYPVPYPVHDTVLKYVERPAPIPDPIPEVIPAPKADIPPVAQTGNTYNTYYNNCGCEQQAQREVIYAEPQQSYYTPRQTSWGGYQQPYQPYGPYTNYYNPYPSSNFSLGLSYYNNQSYVNNTRPPNVNPTPVTPGGPSGAPGHGVPNVQGTGPSGAPGHGTPIIQSGGGPSGAPGSNGPFGAVGHQ